jgi:hypothetical protein
LPGEVSERFGRQVVLVRRVGVGSDVGIVRRVEAQQRAGFTDAVEFGDDGEQVVDVFDHLIADDHIELVIRKRIGHHIEIVNHVGVCFRVAVEADAAGRLVDAAADVENFHRGKVTSSAACDAKISEPLARRAVKLPEISLGGFSLCSLKKQFYSAPCRSA